MKLRSRAVTQLAGFSSAAAFRSLIGTLSCTLLHHETPDVNPYQKNGPPALYCLWHDAILVPLASLVVTHPVRPLSALVSRHQDGSYLVEFMKRIGVESVRGSSQRGGDEAVRQLLRLSESSDIFITPDGPRGPRREAKLGILFLAAQTGRPIIPMGAAASASWRVQGKWTDLLVPKPFSRTMTILGAPLYVPERASRDELRSYQKRLEDEMVRVEQVAEQYLKEVPMGLQRAA